MSALMIARITVKDQEKFEQYLAASKKTAAPYGAELLLRARTEKTLNGDDDHTLTVIARFPSTEKIDAWFASNEYQPLVALRDEATDMHMTSYEVLD